MNALPSRLIPTLQFNLLCHIGGCGRLSTPTRANTVFLVNGEQHTIRVKVTEELKQRIREIYDMVYNDYRIRIIYWKVFQLQTNTYTLYHVAMFIWNSDLPY